MKTWTPLIVGVVITLLLNAFPWFMAFVIQAPGWAQAGWAYYFFTIPAGVVLLLLGLIISLVLFFRRRNN